jgi:hypothetical protein
MKIVQNSKNPLSIFSLKIIYMFFIGVIDSFILPKNSDIVASVQ